MFEGLFRALTGAADGRPVAGRSEPAFAVALLLIEMARSDDSVDPRERSIIARTLTERFGLGAEEVSRLVAAAEAGADQASDLFHSTQSLVRNLSEAERIGIIEMLWEVAYADDVLTGDEDALIRRIAGLIYVSDWDRGEARRRVLQRRAG